MGKSRIRAHGCESRNVKGGFKREWSSHVSLDQCQFKRSKGVKVVGRVIERAVKKSEDVDVVL
jgi:hypothetical protein